MPKAMVKTFTSTDLRAESLQEPTLVDFWAPWCGPCMMVEPVIQQLADDNQGKLTVGRLNIDEQPEAAMTYRVMTIPTLILFKGGQPVERISGARSANTYQQMVDAHLE